MLAIVLVLPGAGAIALPLPIELHASALGQEVHVGAAAHAAPSGLPPSNPASSFDAAPSQTAAASDPSPGTARADDEAATLIAWGAALAALAGAVLVLASARRRSA